MGTHGAVTRILSIVLAAVLGGGTPARTDAPYPRGTAISGISFDFSRHRRLALGSDNWPLTWADDDHQYTSWGDGGGFSGDDHRCRVSLGFARVEGTANAFVGRDLWGDSTCADHPATFGGKTRTVLMVDGVLYFWGSPGSDRSGLDHQRLYASHDRGARWRHTNVEWTFDEHRMGLFAFLQFGRDYAGSRDGYVYIYASSLLAYDWDVQRPGSIVLMRVPKSEVETQTAYEFFAGTDGSGRPRWGPFAERAPVFVDPNGVMRTSAIYNPGLRRYLLVTNHTRDERGNIGIFDAPEPWGPWTTVLYERAWPRSIGVEPTTFFANFAPKWWSRDGKHFVFVFTGTRSNDSWNSVQGAFQTAEGAP